MERSKAPTRVVHLVLQLEYGGAETIAVLHAIHLARAGVDVEVWSLDRGGGNVQRLQRAGISVEVLEKGPGFSFAALQRLRSLLNERRPDVVHAHNTAAARWAALATGGSRPRPILVWTEHTYHEDRKLYQAANHWIFGGRFDAIVGVCRTITERHRRTDWLWRRRYRTLDNAIETTSPDVSRSRAREMLGLRGDAPIVMNLGNLRPAKGQADLIRAFAALRVPGPPPLLVIVGEGALRIELRTLAIKEGVADRVILAGHRADAAELLVAADVIVQSSVREGMPISLLEAARAERPIVATDVGGTREFVEHGVTGWVVPPGDPAALTDALEHALGDPAMARRVAAAARRRLLERHDVAVVAPMLRRIYEELLAKRQPHDN